MNLLEFFKFRKKPLDKVAEQWYYSARARRNEKPNGHNDEKASRRT